MTRQTMISGVTTTLAITASCALSIFIVARFPLQVLALSVACFVVALLARLLPAGGCYWSGDLSGHLTRGSIVPIIESHDSPVCICRLECLGRGHDGTLVAKFEILSKEEKAT